ncbi:MAG: ribosome small subunit-dependent GTPase A [Desulfitobacterium hafniense]|nr:ribosome small subunit-dependent GTPase A [Desulfitobacterium hafniense]
MIEGIILKGYSGFYYVFADDRVWECSLRGRFRIKDQEFLPGDRVKILPGSGIKATVEEVEPRKNSLVRPTIANVDQAILIFAVVSPEPDLNLLDRLIIQVTHSGITPIIVLTKIDLLSGKDSLALDLNQYSFYTDMGYKLLSVSSKTNVGIPELRQVITGKVSVLAGPSGVGKSSLLNALSPGLELKTGEVSQKLKRGRHTTRHVELMVCSGGLVADTPGFSSLYLPKLKREELPGFFPDFEPYRYECRFNSCLHDKEPDCAVKEAVAEGKISPSRFEHYKIFLQEVIAAERRY